MLMNVAAYAVQAAAVLEDILYDADRSRPDRYAEPRHSMHVF